MLKKIAKILGGLVGTLLLAGLVIYIWTNPEQPPADSSSAQWLEDGPFAVGQTDFVFVDDSRTTMANGEFPEKPERTLVTTVWYPQDDAGSHPLIIHSHGFVSARNDLAYMAENLASHGYVVAAMDYPLTAGATPGGPNAADMFSQPVDISFVIDSMFGLSGEAKPFAGELDSERIGLTGYSLGGLTTTLATYHPRLKDSRIAAAVSIAGPAFAFTEKFYENQDVPFLMISGTSDALVDHATNALIIPERMDKGELLAIAGGTHLGFAAISEPLMRFSGNPDSLGCGAVLGNLDSDPNEIIADAGSIEEGVYADPDAPGICEKPISATAAHPGRQQMITQLGTLSFFQAQFATDPAVRSEARQQLSTALARDFEEASFTP